MKSALVEALKVKSGQVKISKVKAVQVKTSKVKAVQVKTSKVKSVRAKSPQVEATPATPKNEQGIKRGKRKKVEQNMTPNNDEDIYDGYTSDDYERDLNAYDAKITELKKSCNVISNAKAIYEKRKGNNAASTQQVIICLLTIQSLSILCNVF